MVSLLLSGLVFAVSLGALLVASDLFTSAAERLSLALGVSPFLVGATVVAGGTSLPELVSSVLAVFAGDRSWNGSRIERGEYLPRTRSHCRHSTNSPDRTRTGSRRLTATDGLRCVPPRGRLGRYHRVVRGCTGDRRTHCLRPLHALHERATRRPHRRVGGEHTEGTDADEVAVEPDVGVRTYVTIAGSLAVVFVAADQFVDSILSVAATLGVGTELVAMTAVAVGTSLPEITVSVTAVRRGSSELTVGNVLGSNVFNTFAVVGVPSLLTPLPVPSNVRGFALPVMVLATLLYYFITQDREITRWEGVTLIVLYAAFVVNLAG